MKPAAPKAMKAMKHTNAMKAMSLVLHRRPQAAFDRAPLPRCPRARFGVLVPDEHPGADACVPTASVPEEGRLIIRGEA
jgi:hypothetical protein